ncbi:MAG: OB-fold nucleic acid binding domain-containing protein [Nocardioidaceae bacterium]
MTDVKARWRRNLSRWASSDDLDAKELRSDTAKAGCCPIADAADREYVELQGSLRTVTLRPRGGVPALEAELYDGSGVITLIWLGRRRIAGVEPGRQVRVSGRIGVQEKARVMYNPRYELRY